MAKMIKTRCSSFELIESSLLLVNNLGYYFLLDSNLHVIYRCNPSRVLIINRELKQLNFSSAFGNNIIDNYLVHERPMIEMEFQQIGDWICKVPTLAGLMKKMNGDVLIFMYNVLSRLLIKDIASVIVTMIMDIFRYDVNHYQTNVIQRWI